MRKTKSTLVVIASSTRFVYEFRSRIKIAYVDKIILIINAYFFNEYDLDHSIILLFYRIILQYVTGAISNFPNYDKA